MSILMFNQLVISWRKQMISLSTMEDVVDLMVFLKLSTLHGWTPSKRLLVTIFCYRIFIYQMFQ